MGKEKKRSLVTLVALALSTMAISLCWTGMKFPELAYGIKFLDLMSGWSLSYFIIAEVAIMPLAGKLIDVYGMKSPCPQVSGSSWPAEAWSCSPPESSRCRSSRPRTSPSNRISVKILKKRNEYFSRPETGGLTRFL